MTTDKPQISVIIPAYNREQYLAAAISSILAQTYQPLEVIVVDDGSTDSSAEVVRSFGKSVRYYFQVNSGVSVARNQGVELAKGEFLAFLDSDDLWMPEKLALQVAAFANTPNLDIVFGHVHQFFSPEVDDIFREKFYIPVEVMPGYHAGTMLIRRETFLRVGTFEPQARTGQFVKWYMCATDLGLQILMLPDVVMQRRVHTTNIGIDQHSAATKQYIHAVKASLDRRRVKV